MPYRVRPSAQEGLILAVDTTTSWCSACLWRDGAALAAREEDLGRGHAERLAPMVRDLFQETGRTPSDVRRVACTVGPGSFMGVRVGLAFARSFAAGLGPPGERADVHGVTSLEALMPESAAGPRAAVIDARRGQIYVQAFGTKAGEADAPFVAEPAAAAERLRAVFGGAEPALYGSGAALLADRLDHASIDRHARPNAVRVAALAAPRPRAEAPPAPLYLRPPDAKAQGPAPFAA